MRCNESVIPPSNTLASSSAITQRFRQETTQYYALQVIIDSDKQTLSILYSFFTAP